MRVTHVITGLDTGGAETLLARLLEQVDPGEVDSTVISLKEAGPVAASIEASGVPVAALDMPPRPLPSDVARLRRAIVDAAPQVVQTWMLHANVLGGITARLASLGSGRRIPVVWGVHVSVVDPATFGRGAALTQRVERAIAARIPARIVACSQSAFDVLEQLNYPGGKLELIANGFDLDRFQPDPSIGRDVRRELGLPQDALVVGHVARFHPIKDHRTLLEAADAVLKRVPDARFVLCGAGVTEDNRELAAQAASLGDSVRLLGERPDVGRLYQAFDVLASSSAGEALPLVIGEAMACSVPVAATRCGDSPQLVGDTGRVVPVADPAALADAITGLLVMDPDDRRRLGAEARRRIGERYELHDMTRRYVTLWRQVSGAPRQAEAEWPGSR